MDFLSLSKVTMGKNYHILPFLVVISTQTIQPKLCDVAHRYVGLRPMNHSKVACPH